VLDVLHKPRFADQPPAQVYAKLLDEGRYLCSIRTMHRLRRNAADPARGECSDPATQGPSPGAAPN